MARGQYSAIGSERDDTDEDEDLELVPFNDRFESTDALEIQASPRYTFSKAFSKSAGRNAAKIDSEKDEEIEVELTPVAVPVSNATALKIQVG
jgi:hypothetical protein